MPQSLVTGFVGRSATVPSGIGPGDAWKWFLNSYVGSGTEYDMECRFLDFLVPANNKISLHDKWVYLLLASGYAGNEDGMRNILNNLTFFNPNSSISWKAVYLANSGFCGNVGEGGTITMWEDASGNGNHLVQNVANATYTESLAGLNNRPAVVFDGSAILQSSVKFNVGAQPVSYVVITYVDAAAATRTILDSQTVFDTCRFSLNGSDAMQLLASTSTTTQTVSEGAAHCLTATFNGASSFTTYDGVASTTVNPGTNYTTSGIRLGAAYNGAQKYSGKIAFVGIYAGDITADPNWTNFKFWATLCYGITFS